MNEKKGLTFARGLRSILRHDPDKVMVGEIRDEETAQIAIQSALTGHLVFTTVHANNVVDVLGRFLNMKVELYNFVSALNCVLAQRLVRKICPHCRERVRADARSSSRSPRSTPGMMDGVTFYEGRGCIECNGTGFYGRMAITELLDLSDQHPRADPRPAARLRDQAGGEGRGHDLPARVGAQEGLRGRDDASRDQQGDLRGLTAANPFSRASGARRAAARLRARRASGSSTSGPPDAEREGACSAAPAFRVARRRPLPPRTRSRPDPDGSPLAGPALAGALQRLLAEVGVKIPAASLVVPDGWVKLLVIDVEEPERHAREVEEMLALEVRPRVRRARAGAPALVAARGAGRRRERASSRSRRPEPAASSWETPFEKAGIRIGALETGRVRGLLARRAAPSGEAFLVWADDDTATTLVFADGAAALRAHAASFADRSRRCRTSASRSRSDFPSGRADGAPRRRRGGLRGRTPGLPGRRGAARVPRGRRGVGRPDAPHADAPRSGRDA